MRRPRARFLIAVAAVLAGSAALAQQFQVPVFGPETFTRGRGKPVTEVRGFTVDGAPQPGLLRIENGAGGHRVTSAVVRLNGVTVAGPDDFQKKVALIEREVELAAENELRVQLRGKPGSALAVTIFAAEPPVPEIEILEPPPGLVTAADSVDVSGAVSGRVDAVEVNGVEAVLAGATFEALAIPLVEGTNRIVATASNADGETASDSVSVRRDTTPPLVVIETPRDGERLVDETVTVAGTVNDIIPGATVNADDVSVMVNGLPAAVNNRTFILPDLPLALGTNTIEAVAVDRVGNTASAAISVSREPDLAGIRVTIQGGNNQRAPIGTSLPVPFTVRLTDQAGSPLSGRPVEFTVSRGDGLLGDPGDRRRKVALLTDAGGEAGLGFTLGSRTGEGFHRVRATTPGSLAAVEFCATAEPADPAQISITLMPPSFGVAAQPLGSKLSVIVTDSGGNPVPGVDVVFQVDEGGGSFAGAESVAVTTNADGISEAEWTLGPEAGRANNVASATFAGNPGLPAVFTVSGVTPGPIENTKIVGIVQDSSGNRLESVRAVLHGTDIDVFSGTDGRFVLRDVPPGGHRVLIQGSNANTPQEGTFFPDIEFAIEAVSGVDNELDQVVALPLLDRDNATLVGGDEDVILTMADTPGFAVKVFANSVVLPDGTRGEIKMSSSQVKFDKVPMAPPQGSTPLVVGTLQPGGIHFDPPAQVIYPNVEGLAPGDVADIFAFHHDIGQFVNVGPGTVSEDGSVIASDPGFGLTQSGWHCVIRIPGPAGKCENCDCEEGACETCDGGSCVAVCEQDCETCDDGVCLSLCDTANCQTCTGGDCVDACDPTCESCDNGACVPLLDLDPEPIVGAAVEVDFTKIQESLELVKKVAEDWVPVPLCKIDPPLGSLKAKISVTENEACCDGLEKHLTTYAGSLTAGLGKYQCDFPVGGVPGLTVNVRLGAGADLAFSIEAAETCESTNVCGKAALNASLKGGVSVVVLSGVIDAELTLQPKGVKGELQYCTEDGVAAALCVASVDLVGQVEFLFVTEQVTINLASGLCIDIL